MALSNDLTDNPLVSICMPAFNAARYVAQAIETVLRQSYTNWELIIVNDGSTDDTAAILQRFVDKRIRIYDQSNEGQSAAANQAFNSANGQLIKFMDADDLLSPDFIFHQVSAIGGRTDAIAVSSWGRFYHDDLSSFVTNDQLIFNEISPLKWMVSNMEGRQAMMQCALWLIPKQLLQQSGLWNETLSLINDFEFFIRVLLKAVTIVSSPRAILYYRSGDGNSLSALRSEAHVNSAFRSIELGNGHLLRYENSGVTRKIAANNFLYFIYDIYPSYPELILKAKQRIQSLGGGDVPFPAGGYTKVLAKLIGWKLAKKIKKRLL
jgi:glycosyltransferase involved in cell wall biosynthesis